MSRTNHNSKKEREGTRFAQPYRRISRKAMLEQFEQEYIRKNQSPLIVL